MNATFTSSDDDSRTERSAETGTKPRTGTAVSATTYECGSCGSTFRYHPTRSYSRQYCSTDCYYRGVARYFLDFFDADHRWCSNCIRRNKEVEPPGRYSWSSSKHKPVPDWAIGRAFALPVADHGLQEEFAPADPLNDVWEREPVRHIGCDPDNERTTCSCGATHHRTRTWSPSDPLPTDQAVRIAGRIADGIETLREQGRHDRRFDRENVLDAVRHGKSLENLSRFDDRIFETAFGVSIRQHDESTTPP